MGIALRVRAVNRFDAPKFNLKHGYVNAFELAIRFHHWWVRFHREHGRDPEWREIAERWDITRSTAYRWRDGYIAALGRAHEVSMV